VIDIPLATSPENNVVVHAAAGTGKTWLLTSRILRLLLEGSAPGSILAITFTRKAAGEIHQRVSERLFAMASASDSDLDALLKELGVEPDATHRHKARGLYETHLNAIHALRTTTFHAFCQEILQRFPLEAEVPPGFELIESTAALEDAAWQTLERQLRRLHDSPLAYAMDILLRECNGVANARKALDEFLSYRSDWWAYTENQADPAGHATSRLQQALVIEDETDPLDTFISNPDLRERASRYAQLLAKNPTATNLAQVEKLTQAFAAGHAPDRRVSLFTSVFLTDKGTPRVLKATKTLAEKLGAAGQEELLRLNQEITTQLLEAQARHKRYWTYTTSRAWFVCGQTLLGHYQRLKEESGVLDFSDLEWKTCHLLNRSRHAEWVQYKLDQRIDHLLVDEFQDTNPTQWRLLLPLLEEMVAGDPERRRSVFLVGDEKQSIYRFRRADPRLFHTARDWLTAHAQAETFTQHISWRSSPAIIRFVNLVFHLADGEDAADALPDDFLLHGFNPHDTHRQKLWGKAEVLPLIRRKKIENAAAAPALRNPLEAPRLVEEDERHREEGELIAGKIRELLDVPVADGNGSRLLNYGDIMLLLRDRTHAQAYEDALRDAGIPYIGTGRSTFLDSLEVRDLISLLRILIEPYNNLALAVSLRSPVFSATDTDLVLLAQHAGSDSRYEHLQRMTGLDAARTALVRAQQWLPRWRAYADRIPVHDLLDRIYSEGDLVARYVASAPAHLKLRVEANLNRFLELALEVDSGRYPSLAHFLDRLETLGDEKTDQPPEPSWNRQPRVRVMTIHGAKGLEAPVVFLADAARDGSNRDRGVRSLIEWPVTHAQPRHFHLIGNKDMVDEVSQALLGAQNMAARREEANLLYVALTRAKQILYVSGVEPARGGRGWYGFIEKRLRRAETTGQAETIGLEVSHVTAEDDKTIFNTCAKIEFGDRASAPAAIPIGLLEEQIVDPALLQPLPVAEHRGMLQPSHLAPEGDTSTDEPVPADISKAMKQRGIAIHRMLEQLTGGKTRPEVEKALHREFSEAMPEAEFLACWREACAVVDHAALREFYDPSCYETAHNEIPILYRDGGQDVYGIVDRLVIGKDRMILIDYKTHRRATTGNIRALAEEFMGQMRQYAAGASRLWPNKKLRAVLLFTTCRGIVEIPWP
jgi:ATP-dependent helicase/nuclease subunit A